MYYDMPTGKLHRIPSKMFRHKMVYALLPVSGKLFIGSYGGLNIYDKASHKLSSVSLPGVKYPIVNSLAYDVHNNCVWMGTDGKLLSYKLSSRDVEVVCEFSGCYLKSIVSDAQNNRLLIGTETGVLDYQIATGLIHKIEHDVHNPQSLCNNFISKLYQDASNNLWVATDNGISMIQQAPLIQDIKLTDFVDSRKGNLFTCMLHPSDKEYWLGGENGLLYVSEERTIGIVRTTYSID